MRNWAEWIQETRKAMKNIERMLTESRDERDLRALNKQLESLTRNFPQYIAMLKDQADDWGQWEKYEAMTHIKEPRTASQTA
jgi:Sec-independent protein translocase protein TatA